VGLAEDAMVPLTRTREDILLFATVTASERLVDITPLVNPSCRCLDSHHADFVQVELQVLLATPFVYPARVQLRAPSGTLVWTVDVDRTNTVGEWTTLYGRAQARSSNAWGSNTGWDGSAPWNNVQATFERHALFGIPSLADLPRVRNVKLYISRDLDQPLARYLFSGSAALTPVPGSGQLSAGNDEAGTAIHWRELNEYGPCIVAPPCEPLDMVEYYTNLGVPVPGADIGGTNTSEGTPGLSVVDFPPSNTEVLVHCFWGSTLEPIGSSLPHALRHIWGCYCAPVYSPAATGHAPQLDGNETGFARRRVATIPGWAIRICHAGWGQLGTVSVASEFAVGKLYLESTPCCATRAPQLTLNLRVQQVS